MRELLRNCSLGELAGLEIDECETQMLRTLTEATEGARAILGLVGISSRILVEEVALQRVVDDPRTVAHDQRKLDVHLDQRLLHTLDEGPRALDQRGPMPEIAAQGDDPVGGPKAPAQQAEDMEVAQPLAIRDITLAPGEIFDVPRVDEDHLEAPRLQARCFATGASTEPEQPRSPGARRFGRLFTTAVAAGSDHRPPGGRDHRLRVEWAPVARRAKLVECRRSFTTVRTASSSIRQIAVNPRTSTFARDASRAKFWLAPVRLARSGGFGAAELLRLERIVSERQSALSEAWNEYFTNAE